MTPTSTLAHAPASPASSKVYSGTEAQKFSAFTLGLDLDDVPAALVEKAKGHLLDGLGIALASTGFDYGRSIVAGARALAGSGDATAFGFGDKLPPVNAALVNGVLIHGLDFDDTHVTAIYHATAPALAAAFAAAEASGSTGRETLIAYIAGLEIGCRLGRAAEGGFHDRGFHPTAICGTFAAAFAAGRLLGLSPDRMVWATSLAGSQAAGILETGGSSWLKRFHPGWAAHAGYSAAVLAKNGFVGAKTVFEGNHGIFQTHLQKIPQGDLVPSAGLNSEWQIAGIALKPYPCCHFIHGFVDAGLYLRDRVDIADIERIDCPLTKRLHPLVGEPRERRIKPTTPYEAMFSVPYVVALALVKGKVDLASFHDLGIDDPDVLALAAKVYVEEDPRSDFPAHFPGEVRITLKNGEIVTRREATSTGTPERALSRDQIEDKFMSLATRVTNKARAREIADAVWRFDELDNVADLARLCSLQSV